MLDSPVLERAMALAITEARRSIETGNAPFGAVLLDGNGEVVCSDHNSQVSDADPAAHAEINVLRKAGAKLGRIKFAGFTMVGNAEPCTGCAAFCIKSDIRMLAWGTDAESSMEPWLRAADVAAAARRGEVELVSGVLSSECDEVLAAGRAAMAARQNSG